jgi:hypothetical protein
MRIQREMNPQSGIGYLFGTDIKILSLKFVYLVLLATFMTLITLGASLFFSIIWLIWRDSGSSYEENEVQGRGGFSIVCISHVPWDGVWQRNQQTMARFSESEKVIYLRSANTLEISANPRHLYYFFGNKITENLLVINPVILWGDTRFGLIRRVNRWILLSFIRFGMIRSKIGFLPVVRIYLWRTRRRSRGL